jgi:alanyl-tRNA synthetase
VLSELEKEEDKFRKTLEKGLKELEKVIVVENLSGTQAFDLYQTYGFPLELIEEELQQRGVAFEKDFFEKEFFAELEKHQELSRTASAGKFRGGLADHSEKTTQLHTAAHLMLAGLREILGTHVHQKGSNITGERIRFDFAHPEKMTDEQKKKLENFVNQAIKSAVPVVMREMSLEEARNCGAEGVFENKYSDKVKVYSIEGISSEICGGPHVTNTADIKGVFKIKKEESSSAGVRRIKAVVE